MRAEPARQWSRRLPFGARAPVRQGPWRLVPALDRLPLGERWTARLPQERRQRDRPALASVRIGGYERPGRVDIDREVVPEPAIDELGLADRAAHADRPDVERLGRGTRRPEPRRVRAEAAEPVLRLGDVDIPRVIGACLLGIVARKGV